MSDRYVSAELLFQFHSAAISVAQQLGAAERDVENLKRENAALRTRPMMPFDDVKPGKIVPCDERMNPYSIESKEDLEKSELWRMQQVAISVISGCNTRGSFQSNRLLPDNAYRTAALGHVEEAIIREITLIEKLDIAKAALKRLSCLGNGDAPGNSTGNCMAQAALTQINLIKFEV